MDIDRSSVCAGNVHSPSGISSPVARLSMSRQWPVHNNTIRTRLVSEWNTINPIFFPRVADDKSACQHAMERLTSSR